MKTLVLILLAIVGSYNVMANGRPYHFGVGSNQSTIGKISSYSPKGSGLWTGFWKPNQRVPTSIKEYSWESQVMAWPNPSTGNLNINYTGLVKIFNASGDFISTSFINEKLNISDLSSGSYIIVTENNQLIKIIKQ